MKIVHIDGAEIKDWDTFHDVFAHAFGFPEYYGRNLDAWIDCMTSLDEEFNRVHVEEGEVVCISIDNAADLKERCPEQYQAFVEGSAFVNWRRLEVGEAPILLASFHV